MFLIESIRRSLRTKTVLSVAIPSTLILVFVAIIAFFAYEHAAQDIIQQRDTEIARILAARLSEVITRYSRVLQRISVEDDVQTMEPTRLISALGKAQNQLHVFDGGIVVYNSEGIALWSQFYTAERQGTDFPIPSEFDRVQATLRPVFSNIFKDRISNEDVVLVGIPIVGKSGEFKGVLAGISTIKYSLLGATFAKALEFKGGYSGYAYLVDSNGRLIYHRHGSLIGKLATSMVVMQVTKGETGAVFTKDEVGETVISAFAPVPGTDWGLVAQERWENIIGPVRGYSSLLIVILVVGGVVSSVLIFFEIGRVLKPIKDLVSGAQRVTKGNFDYTIVAKTGDEIQTLAQQFNTMAGALKKSYADLEQRLVEQKKAEEKLRKERDFNNTLIQASPAFFVAISADYKTIMMNEAMLRALGYTQEEVVDKDYLTTFVPEREHEMLSKIFEKLVKSKEPTLNENHILTKDGRELLVEWHGRPVFKENGEYDFFFGVGIDITKRKRVEEELKKRLDELEIYYRSTVGREGRIVELKQEVNKLMEELGKERKYGA